MSETKEGMYWHCHHDKLCEYCYDYEERVKDIKENKPLDERETRLKLFRPVKIELPELFVKADAEWEKTCAEWEKVYQTYLPELERLHKEDCGCKEWNGSKIVFDRKETKNERP